MIRVDVGFGGFGGTAVDVLSTREALRGLVVSVLTHEEDLLVHDPMGAAAFKLCTSYATALHRRARVLAAPPDGVLPRHIIRMGTAIGGTLLTPPACPVSDVGTTLLGSVAAVPTRNASMEIRLAHDLVYGCLFDDLLYRSST